MNEQQPGWLLRVFWHIPYGRHRKSQACTTRPCFAADPGERYLVIVGCPCRLAKNQHFNMATRDQLDNLRPDGMPMACFVRIDPPSQGGRMDDLTISKDYKSVTLTSKSEEKRTKVMAVIDAESSTRNVYEQTIRQASRNVALGTNLSVLFVGGSKTSKRQTYEGVVPLFIEALSTELNNLKAQAQGKYTFSRTHNIDYLTLLPPLFPLWSFLTVTFAYEHTLFRCGWPEKLRLWGDICGNY